MASKADSLYRLKLVQELQDPFMLNFLRFPFVHLKCYVTTFIPPCVLRIDMCVCTGLPLEASVAHQTAGINKHSDRGEGCLILTDLFLTVDFIGNIM